MLIHRCFNSRQSYYALFDLCFYIASLFVHCAIVEESISMLSMMILLFLHCIVYVELVNNVNATLLYILSHCVYELLKHAIGSLCISVDKL